MNDGSKQVRQGPAGPKLSELVDAAGIGVERKIAVTLRDVLLRPGRAASAAFDRSPTHVSQLKLFVVLGGLFLSAGAFFGAPMTPTVEGIAPPGGVEAAYASIAAQGADPAAIDASLSRWGGFLAWPMTLISSVVFIVALKLVRPYMTWYGHLLVYLIATNAMTLAAIPLVAARLVSLELYLALQLSTILIFFVQMMRLGSSALELSASRLVILFVVLAICVLPAVLISGLLQLGSIWLILGLHGVSFPDMMAAAIDAAATAPGGP